MAWIIGLTSIEKVLGVLQFVFAGGESELLLQLKKRKLIIKIIMSDFFINAFTYYNGIKNKKVVLKKRIISRRSKQDKVYSLKN